MTPLILLGNPETKRTAYFQKAAAEAGVPCLLWEWERRPFRFPRGSSVKIDPPLWASCNLKEMDGCVCRYRKDLAALAHLSGENNLQFLNHPDAIWALLDKRSCKARLLQAGLPVTESLTDAEDPPISSTEQLMEKMAARRIFQVFVKPVYGSGAAAAAAFRFQPGSGQMALYTCAAFDPSSGQLVNAKKLRRFSQAGQVFPLLNRILKLNCIVERWHAKSEYQGFSYDLRAVVQDGCLDFLLARLSKGPITNLHLNNRPLSADALALSSPILDSILELCQRAVRCFPGLRSAGIDILLEKGSQRPRIIEMNGQGDLIHQDIYQENSIYRHQISMQTGEK